MAVMPITYHIDREQAHIHTVAEGRVTLRDVRAHLEEERGDRGLGFGEIVDARGATLALTPGEVRQIVALLRELGKRSALGPTAVLVSTDHAFGMLRMLETLVEDVCAIRPFRDEDAARAWLATQRPAPPTGPLPTGEDG
jgi:hypothetical protein